MNHEPQGWIESDRKRALSSPYYEEGQWKELTVQLSITVSVPQHSTETTLAEQLEFTLLGDPHVRNVQKNIPMSQGLRMVRDPEEIHAVLQTHRNRLQEIANRLEADERGGVSSLTSTEKEEAWANRDTLDAEVATLAWVLQESDTPAYPVEGARAEEPNA